MNCASEVGFRLGGTGRSALPFVVALVLRLLLFHSSHPVPSVTHIPLHFGVGSGFAFRRICPSSVIQPTAQAAIE